MRSPGEVLRRVSLKHDILGFGRGSPAFRARPVRFEAPWRLSLYLFAALCLPTSPRREPLGNQLRHRNTERLRDKDHFVIGYLAEDPLDLRDASAADVEAPELALPGKI